MNIAPTPCTAPPGQSLDSHGIINRTIMVTISKCARPPRRLRGYGASAVGSQKPTRDLGTKLTRCRKPRPACLKAQARAQHWQTSSELNTCFCIVLEPTAPRTTPVPRWLVYWDGLFPT